MHTEHAPPFKYQQDAEESADHSQCLKNFLDSPVVAFIVLKMLCELEQGREIFVSCVL